MNCRATGVTLRYCTVFLQIAVQFDLIFPHNVHSVKKHNIKHEKQSLIGVHYVLLVYLEAASGGKLNLSGTHTKQVCLSVDGQMDGRQTVTLRFPLDADTVE